MTMPRPAEAERPWPDLDLDSEPFWRSIRERQLRLQRCADCKKYRFPPMPMCPECNSFNNEWVPAQGAGVVHSWIVVRRSAHPFFSEVPYNVVLVEMAEGVRIFGNLLDAEPDELRADLPVTLDYFTDPDGFTLYGFRRTDTQ